MATINLIDKYLPMTETAYYILLSLCEPKHGYAISKWVSEKTGGRIKLGSGTIYGTISKMIDDNLICLYDEVDNRKIYEITSRGKKILGAEIERINEMLINSEYYKNS